MKKINVAFLMCVALLASGCSTLSQKELNKAADTMRDRIALQKEVNASTAKLPMVEHISGSYLGSSVVPLAYAATLPAIFRDKDITLNFPARPGSNGKVNLATVAARITEATKLPVRIRPDVYLSAKSLIKTNDGIGSEQTGAKPPKSFAPPLPSPMGPVGSLGNAATGSEITDDYDTRLPMEYTGTLAGYLDFISARLGINWEYKDGGITLFRFITKSFAVKVNPGDLKFASSIQKGGSNSGSAGSAGNSTSGATTGSGGFQSDTTATISAQFSLWKSMASAIEGMKTPPGHYTIDEAAGLVIVTDTKETVDAVGSYIDTVNSTLTRQVDLEIRTMTVSTTDTDQAGFNLNLLYQKLSAAGTPEWGAALASPGTLTSANAGTIGFSILRPTSRWNGSNIVAQVLNEMGTIISDQTRTATTTNRVPVPIAQFTTEGYLAATTPGTSSVGGGASIPGLVPGQLTTGSFINILPSAYENGSVLLRMTFDDTVSKGFGVISAGNGSSFQQIQTPTFTGSKSDHSVGLKDGESLVLMANSSERNSGNRRYAITGMSQTASHTRETQIIVVTPRVRAGI